MRDVVVEATIKAGVKYGATEERIAQIWSKSMALIQPKRYNGSTSLKVKQKLHN